MCDLRQNRHAESTLLRRFLRGGAAVAVGVEVEVLLLPVGGFAVGVEVAVEEEGGGAGGGGGPAGWAPPPAGLRKIGRAERRRRRKVRRSRRDSGMRCRRSRSHSDRAREVEALSEGVKTVLQAPHPTRTTTTRPPARWRSESELASLCGARVKQSR